ARKGHRITRARVKGAGDAGRRSAPRSGAGGGDAPGAGQELEGGRGQLSIVPRPHEAPFRPVIVQDAGAWEVVFRLEGVEHQDAGVAREAGIVEEPEGQVVHGRFRWPPFPELPHFARAHDSRARRIPEIYWGVLLLSRSRFVPSRAAAR